MKFVGILAILSSLAAATEPGRLLGQEAFDCDDGCDLGPAKGGPPVCGEDGISYWNECLAVCQGIAVAKRGFCPGAPLANGNSQGKGGYKTNGKVERAKLDRFQVEGFKLVGVADLPEQVDYVDKNRINNGNGKPTRGGAIRITVDGEEYYSAIADAPDETEIDMPPGEGLYDTEPAEQPPTVQQDHEHALRGGDRNLKIIGSDNRSWVGSTTSFPYKVVSEVNWSSSGGCTATIISTTSALTAAHCVYDADDKKWNLPSSISPGRNSFCNLHSFGCSYSTYEPYGYFNVDYVSIYAAYTTSGDSKYDFAVMTFRPQSSGKYPGDRVGYAGFSRTTNDSSALQSATVTGYPTDKPSGEMWKSASCLYTSGQDNKLTKHTCDTSGADSGSSLMNADTIQVMGVHVGEDSDYNLGVVLDRTHFASLLRWSGRDSVGDLRVRENGQCWDWNVNNNNVYIYDCHGNSNQKWYWDASTEQIKSAYNASKCLDMSLSGSKNLYMHTCHNGSNQKWYKDGERIRSRNNNQCIDMKLDGSKNLYVYTCHGGANQNYLAPSRFWT